MPLSSRRGLPAIAVILASVGVLACDADPYPMLRIEAFEYGYEHADTVPAGLTRVRLVNRGNEWHEALLARLADSTASAADYADSARAGVDFPAFAEGFGGPSLTLPDDSTDIIVSLVPGRHAIVCWFKGHLRSGMVSDLMVVDQGVTHRRPPQEAVTLTMLDYSFRLSAPLAAGRNVIRVENRGAEIHEVDVFRLKPGMTSDALVTWQAGDQEGEAPGLPMGGTLDVEPGDHLWLELDLEPGRYVFICIVPAPDGQPHAHKGMVMEVEVERSKPNMEMELRAAARHLSIVSAAPRCAPRLAAHFRSVSRTLQRRRTEDWLHCERRIANPVALLTFGLEPAAVGEMRGQWNDWLTGLFPPTRPPERPFRKC